MLIQVMSGAKAYRKTEVPLVARRTDNVHDQKV